MTEHKPDNVVAGLSEVLLALGDELRAANHEVGQRRTYLGEGDAPEFEPVLFFDQAEVELTATVTNSVEGGVKVWVVAGGGSRSDQRVIRLTIQLNGPAGRELGVGM